MKPTLTQLLVTLLLSLMAWASNGAQLSTCTSALPTVTGISKICGSGSATITLTGESMAQWYTTTVGGVALTTSGSVFNTAVLTANTVFWVAGYNGTCESERTRVDVLVTPLPINPTVTGMSSICGMGSIQVRVVSDFENIWYTASVNGIALDTTGAVYHTPTISGMATYWVSGYDNDCLSARVPVKVETFGIPMAPVLRQKGALELITNANSAHDIYFAKRVYLGYYNFYKNPKDLVTQIGYNKNDIHLLFKEGIIESPNGIIKNLTEFFSYFGTANDSIFANNFGVQWLPGTQGTVKAVTITRSGCISDTAYVYVNVPTATTTGINDYAKEPLIIYPNPNKGTFSIKGAEVVKVTLISSEGKKEEWYGNEVTTKFKGILTLLIETRSKRYLQKLLVE